MKKSKVGVEKKQKTNRKMSGSLEILRRSLAANGLPTSGNKAELLNRLLTGQGDRRKKKGSASSADGLPGVKSDSNVDATFVKFSSAERASLVESGIVDDDAINAEINRRWQVVQSHASKETKAKEEKPKEEKPKEEKKTSKAAPPGGSDSTVTLPTMLTPEDAASANLTFVAPVEGGFMYLRLSLIHI